MRKPNEISDEIDGLICKLKEVDGQLYTYADVRVIAKVGILSALTAEMAEVSSRRLVNLTRALLIFTVALLVFTVFLCVDTHKILKHESAAVEKDGQKQK